MSEPGRRAELGALREELSRIGPMVVAFSGGADSAFVARVATDTLGPDRVLCVTAVSPSLAPEELADCRALAAEWGLRHRRGRNGRVGRPGLRRQRRVTVLPLQDVAAGGPRPLPGAGRRAGRGLDRARGEPRRPGRPPSGPAGRRRAGCALPAGDRGVHQGRRAGLVEGARTAHVGQAGGGVPGLTGPLRDAGHPGHPAIGGRGRVGPAGPGLPPTAGAPLRRHRPPRIPPRGPGRRGGPSG